MTYSKDHVSNGDILDIFEGILEDGEFDTEEEFVEKARDIADQIEEELGRCQRMIENDPGKFASDFDCKIQEYIDEEEAEEAEAEAKYQETFGDDDNEGEEA